MKKSLNSIWESKVGEIGHTVQSEDQSEVDGVHILARVVGPAFFPNTTSRNNIYYPSQAWETAINDTEFQERLRNRLVFGTIGHDPEMTDNEIRQGIHSHIVTKVWIDDNNIGWAEYLVLNTDPGKVLNTLLRAKSKISVSTRAYGEIEDTSPTGAEVVNPDGFTLERIDFVIDPGYKQAKPVLQENNKIKQEENLMTIDTNATVSLLEKRLSELNEENKLSKTDYKTLQEALTEAKVSEAKTKAELEGYRALGDLKTLAESMNTLAKYTALGEVDVIRESLEDGTEAIQELTEEIEELQTKKAELEAQLAENETNGQANEDEFNKVKEELDTYQELATPEELRELLTVAEEVQSELDGYRALGTVDEIKQAFEEIDQFAEENEKAELEDLANEHNTSLEVVQLLKGKGLSVEEIETVLDGVGTVEGSEEVDISEEENQEGEEEIESEDGVEEFEESLSTSILRRLSRVSRIRESKGKVKSRKLAGKETITESLNSSNPLLSKLIRTHKKA